MAIKFSQFVVQTNASALSHIVGYNGADNIQITPADFINSFVPGGPFLPLAGGTMTGNLRINDGVRFQAGSSGDFNIRHNGVDTFQENETGDLYIRNNSNDKNIIFQSDNGSGSTTTYMTVDGANIRTKFSKNTIHTDNIKANFGNGSDLQIYHDGSNSFIRDITGTGDLKVDSNRLWIRSSIGETMGRFTENGSAELYYDNVLRLSTTNTGAEVSGDLVVTGTITGSGGSFLPLTGGTMTGDIDFNDGIEARFGNSQDLTIQSVGDESYIQNYTGNLNIVQNADDKNIIFKSDNGSGGATEYITVDGANIRTKFSKNTIHLDSIKANFGNGSDLQIYHDNSNNYIQGVNGDMYIQNGADDKDIIFRSDDGAGGQTEYFRLDGSLAYGAGPYVYTVFPDNSRLTLGSGTDFRLWHSGTQSYIQNYTGDLNISANLADKDIKFFADDGSGGTTEYFRLDGGIVRTIFSKNIGFEDDVRAIFGASNDLQIYHEGTDSIIQNYTGSVYVDNNADDQDIVFRCDNGSGGITEYFRVDGSSEKTIFSKEVLLNDGVFLKLGGGEDLQIYHDSANSYIETSTSSAGDLYIKANGTGHDLYLRAADDIFIQPQGGETGVKVTGNGGVELYHNNTKKFQTESTGVKISGVSEYADNTAALAGGLTTGDVYRTGDLLKIVH